jgi:nucleotide-binding universal stress UspA family protein
MTIPVLAYYRILVALDGSEAAEFAVPYAADLARKHDAELLLLYLDYLPAVASEADRTPSEEQSQAKPQAHLAALRTRVAGEGLKVRDLTIRSRDLADTLHQVIESEHVSLIVMSTQGRTGMVRWLLGGNIEKALSSLPVPIMLVRPVYHKIVVPLDGSTWSERAIPQAAEIAREHDAELVLIHVYQSPVSEYAPQIALAGQQQMAEQTYEQMHEHLLALRNMLRHQGIRAREHLIRSNNPAQAISDFVESEEGVSMVVMTTHGRTGLTQWLFGSVAQSVIKKVRCPVTLVRPDGQ